MTDRHEAVRDTLENNQERLTDLFGRLGIRPQAVEHPPVHTVEDALVHWQALDGAHTKNVFLKDNRGGSLHLVTVGARTRLDLKRLAPMIGAKKLSFASADTLMEVLGTAPGAVGPLSLVNDSAHRVSFAIERTLTEAARLTCHPLRNTATVALTWVELSTILAALGIEPQILDLQMGAP